MTVEHLSIDEAKRVLAACVREELRDHAFGDCEVYWARDIGDGFSVNVAEGYFGNESEVTIGDGFIFRGEDAMQLRWLGTAGRVERNDAG